MQTQDRLLNFIGSKIMKPQINNFPVRRAMSAPIVIQKSRQEAVRLCRFKTCTKKLKIQVKVPATTS